MSLPASLDDLKDIPSEVDAFPEDMPYEALCVMLLESEGCFRFVSELTKTHLHKDLLYQVVYTNHTYMHGFMNPRNHSWEVHVKKDEYDYAKKILIAAATGFYDGILKNLEAFCRGNDQTQLVSHTDEPSHRP